MRNELPGLRADVKYELDNLLRLLVEWKKIKESKDSLAFVESRAIGSILHDFYSGIEKIFKRIAVTIDRSLPEGDDWHIQLLNRMAIKIDGIRPEIISEELKNKLGEYLGFRHVFRNIYGFELSLERTKFLAESLENTYKNFKEAIDKFESFLSKL